MQQTVSTKSSFQNDTPPPLPLTLTHTPTPTPTTTTTTTPNANCSPNPDSRLVNLDPLFMTYYFGGLLVVTSVTLAGNLLVMATVYRHRCLWLPANAFVCSLAASDFLFGAVFPLYNVAGINRPGVTGVLGE